MSQTLVGWERGLAAYEWLPALVQRFYAPWTRDLERTGDEYPVGAASTCLCSSNSCPRAAKQPACAPSWLCAGALSEPPLGLQLEQLEVGLSALEKIASRPAARAPQAKAAILLFVTHNPRFVRERYKADPRKAYMREVDRAHWLLQSAERVGTKLPIHIVVGGRPAGLKWRRPLL